MPDAALRTTLCVAPGHTLAPGPYGARDDGVIFAADGSVVCVLGTPEDDLTEQDLANGAAVLALPDLIAALEGVRTQRPSNWDDDQDDIPIWTAIDAALAKARGLPSLPAGLRQYSRRPQGAE